jgi:DNA-binding Lrp family transcriptional regulator
MKRMSAASRLSQTIFKLSTSELSGEINLKPEVWRVLSQVNGVRTLGEIAQAVGMSPETASQIAETLLQTRILEVAGEGAALAQATVNGAFFDSIALELARAMGPMARLVIKDAVGALGETQESFPRERLADLIENVSEEIRDPNKRVRFQQVMLEAIRKL